MEQIGRWQSHLDGDPLPRDEEGRLCASERRRLGAARYLLLVWTPADDGWVMTAWVFSEDPDDPHVDICEAASIEPEGAHQVFVKRDGTRGERRT